jgi:hypothetical protein
VFRDRSRRHLEKSTWGGWTRQAFSGWPQYFRFALPSVIMGGWFFGGGKGGG